MFATGPARATSEEDKAAAEALFDDGRKLMADHKYDEACSKLADSQRLDPGVGTLLNLALCYKESGKTASAWSTYREAAAEAREQGQPDREAMARQEAERLESKLTRIKLAVPPAVAAIDGLQIARDGKPVLQSLWTTAVPVDPGPHVLEVTAPGRQPARVQVDARGEGGSVEVAIPEPPVQGASVAAPAPTAPAAAAVPPSAPPGASASGAAPVLAPGPTSVPAPGPGADTSAHKPTAGYVLTGVGVVGLGVATVFGLQAHSKNDDALKICQDPNGPCSVNDVARHTTLVNDAKSARTVAYVGAGTGVVALGAGIVLIATSHRTSPTAGGAPRVSPLVTESARGIVVSGFW